MNISGNTYFSRPIMVDNKDLAKTTTRLHVAAEEEMARIPRTNGVVVDPMWVRFINCPVCSSELYDQYLNVYGFIFVECRLCSHIFVHNLIREGIIIDLYQNSDHDKESQARRTRPDGKQLMLYWDLVYEKYSTMFGPNMAASNRNILDVGCGDGQFLAYCKQHTNYVIHGIEFCEEYYDHLIELIGYDRYYHKQKIEDIDFADKKFSLITLWGVFEHITNPISVLQKCLHILDDNGCVLILVPNIHSRAARIMGVHTPTLMLPRSHINFFTRKSMSILCDIVGLKITDFLQELPVIDVMYPFIDYNDALVEDILKKDECYYHCYVLKKNTSGSSTFYGFDQSIAESP